MTSAKSDFPVVGVGASAGGLDAYKQFLRAMPPDTGAAFIFIQHLDPNHESMLADILSKHTAMPVVQAENNMALESNTVYVIPPNKFIKLVDHGLFLDEPVRERGVRMSVDYFFRSMAEVRGEKAIGIVLSGTGTDGTLGIRDIKAAGGMVMVQSPESADYDGMPRSAIATGSVDFILPVEEMPESLVSFIRHPYLEAREADTDHATGDRSELRSVLHMLRARTDFDFSCYRLATLERRIQRRMGLRQIGELGDYVSYLRENPEETNLLFRDLLIGVTRFFREPEAWEVFRERAIVSLIEQRTRAVPLRAWVPGCSSGEEPYTLAMIIFDTLDSLGVSMDVQVFATDLNGEAIIAGRTGTYPAAIEADVPAHYLEKFFIRDGETYKVAKRLREKVVFATQNVISDPPFSKLDIICCRNLMIYLEPNIQQRMIEMFHFALAENGYLFLGSSETAARPPRLFEPISKTHRVYRRGTTIRNKQGSFPIMHSREPAGTGGSEGRLPRPATTVSPSEIAHAALLQHYSPAAVLVNSEREVLHFQGPVRDYLDFPVGEPTTDLLTIAVDGVKSKLRGLLAKVAEAGGNEETIARNVRREGREVDVRIEAHQVPNPAGGPAFILVSFEDRSKPQKQAPINKVPAKDEPLVKQLEYELKATKEDLQSTIEEMESANEELKASNEEVMSMNEELQSTNEELETSREELQSLNEELTTVNSQLEDKINELEATNNDLSNLLASTEIATIFLDPELRIRRFTPATRDLLRIIDTDIGRPVEDLTPRVNDPELLGDAREVLKSLQPKEMEVENLDGVHFIRRVRPYRTSDNKINGVVITFTDVSRLRRATERIRIRSRQQEAITELGVQALAEAPLDELFDAAVHAIATQLGVRFAKILELMPDTRHLLLRSGVGWNEGLVGTAMVDAGIRSQAGYTLQRSSAVIVEDFANERRFSAPSLLSDHSICCGASVIIGPLTAPWGVLGAHEMTRGTCEFSTDDVNFMQAVANILWLAIVQSRARQAVEHERQVLRQLTDTLPMQISIVSSDQRYLFNNKAYEEWGHSRSEIEGMSVAELLGKDAYAKARPHIEQALAGSTERFEFSVAYPDGDRTNLVTYAPRMNVDGEVDGFFAAAVDITERKREEERMQVISAELDHRVKNVLATVLGLARMTSRNATSLDQFRSDFEERIHAMARTHSALAEESWEGMALSQLVQSELSPYAEEASDRLVIRGPEISLVAAAIQPLSLAFHELATNAAKYGALGNDKGKLRVEWKTLKAPRGAVQIVWKESGMKNLEPQTSKGFGTRVLENIVPAQLDAEVGVELRPTGLVCSLEIPAKWVLRNGGDRH